MRSMVAAMAMVALGVAGAGLLSGTAPPLDLAWMTRMLPEKLDIQSFLVGGVAGLAMAQVLRVPWRELPRRGLAWVLGNGASFRWMGYGGAFIAVLLLY